METESLGAVRQGLLEAWAETIADSDSGTGFDFTDTNRTRQCQQRVDEFIETPTEETLRALWNQNLITHAYQPTIGRLTSEWENQYDELAAVIEEVRDTNSFDPTWTEKVGDRSIRELYGRLHPEDTPIVDSNAMSALPTFSLERRGNYERQQRELEQFRELYEQYVGHATNGTDHELPLWAEIDAFLQFVAANYDRSTLEAELRGDDAALYRPLLAFQFGSPDTSPIEFEDITAIVDGHFNARKDDAYDGEDTEHWGGNHAEQWKWDYRDYFHDEITSRFELTALTATDIDPFFEALSHPGGIVSDVIRKIMGHRQSVFAYNDFEDLCLANPTEAARVLSILFDENRPIETRLAEIRAFVSPLVERDEHSRSAGSFLRLATGLLMFAYPDRHIAFQYRRFNKFFSEKTPLDKLEQGYTPQQYHQIARACRRLLEDLREYHDDADMLDVQTIIWVWNGKYDE
ncbi:hypothetical protein [Haloarcula sp. 1CSR25-25]|uniref:hypothetical protein n=1 Tax=Haloarcula sp. 1CSR25-25 TaxID=2862545 RepID=UPI002895E263|nr:hypothetical protein [Haloarcula sp. 1CSR25-25]MDT3434649.1 hypothetical protein [Haloarcula sp. 1CSR25-25]